MAIRSPKRFATELCVPRGKRIATPVSALVRNDGGNFEDLRNHPTAELAECWLFLKCYEFAAVRAVRMSPWKQCARHTPRTGLIASIALRRTRRKASTSPLMSLLTPGGSKGAAAPFARLSPHSFVVQRKSVPPEVARRRTQSVKPQPEKTKNRAPSSEGAQSISP